MSYPGEYPQPIARVTNAQATIVSGYAGVRLRRQDPVFYAGSGDDTQAQVLLENTGAASFGVQLKQTDDRNAPGTDSSGAPSGTRYDVGSAVVLVPGGTKTLQVSPYMTFLEAWGTNSKGQLRMQIAGRIQYEVMAFDRTPIDTTYAPELYQASPRPEAPAI